MEHIRKLIMGWWKKIKKTFESVVKPEPMVYLIRSNRPSSWYVLLKKRDLYVKQSTSLRDKHGFFPGCDGLLFAALAKVGGVKVDLTAAESNGRFFRTPTKDCYSKGKSGSSISRDMVCGLLWGAYYSRDVSLLKRFIRRSEARMWVIGDGPLSRTFVTPQLQKLTADVLDKLGGGNLRRYRVLPSVYPKGLTGYEAHLQVLQILLKLHMYSKITKTMADRLRDHYNRSPNNVLFSMAYHLVNSGDLRVPVDLLLNLPQFPNDRLPDNLVRSTDYIFQRDPGDDWKPHDKREVYSGSDLIFAVGVMSMFLGD